MSGSKASNQQRTTKKIITHIKGQRLPVRRGPVSTYQEGWNAALEAVAEQLAAGVHLKEPAFVPISRAPGKSTADQGGAHLGRIDDAVDAGLRVTRETLGVCGAVDGQGGPACIHVRGHVEQGQPLHSNGERTWRDRR